MAAFEIVMPKLGESIIEATITKWLVKEGDTIKEEDHLVEIATDKVDSEIPSPVDGKVLKLKFKEGDVVPVGAIIAVINMDNGDENDSSGSTSQEDEPGEESVTKDISKPDTLSESADNQVTAHFSFLIPKSFTPRLLKALQKKRILRFRNWITFPAVEKMDG
jgi:2-oxoglutarate dehydrogenase E2 component (dihydrolipoamide succinyltransferase)